MHNNYISSLKYEFFVKLIIINIIFAQSLLIIDFKTNNIKKHNNIKFIYLLFLLN